MSLVMVRTVCCQTYKCTGNRCSICPSRPENKEAVRKYQHDLATMSFGRRGGRSNNIQIENASVEATASYTHCSQ